MILTISPPHWLSTHSPTDKALKLFHVIHSHITRMIHSFVLITLKFALRRQGSFARYNIIVVSTLPRPQHNLTLLCKYFVVFFIFLLTIFCVVFLFVAETFSAGAYLWRHGSKLYAYKIYTYEYSRNEIKTKQKHRSQLFRGIFMCCRNW